MICTWYNYCKSWCDSCWFDYCGYTFVVALCCAGCRSVVGYRGHYGPCSGYVNYASEHTYSIYGYPPWMWAWTWCAVAFASLRAIHKAWHWYGGVPAWRKSVSQPCRFSELFFTMHTSWNHLCYWAVIQVSECAEARSLRSCCPCPALCGSVFLTMLIHVQLVGEMRRYKFGWVLCLHSGALVWGSKLQTVTAHRTTEGEAYATSNAARTVIPLSTCCHPPPNLKGEC